MPNKEFIKNKINFIQQELGVLAEYSAFSLQEIVSDYLKHTLVERVLERIINDALDINQHIIVESNQGAPNDYKETFVALSKMDIFTAEFAAEISKSVGLRNILAHNYHKLDEEIFYNSIKNCLTDYTKYCDYILRFIDL